jgi:outer membrane protein assembly factor BamB
VSNWITLLAGNDRRGGAVSTRKSAPTELIWKATLPESIRSSPVLHDGVVYVTCLDGHLYALDSLTGKQRWKLQTGAPFHTVDFRQPCVLGL